MSDTDIHETDEGAERRPSRYPHIVKAVFDTPWAILPSRLQAIVEVVTLRVSGERLTDDEIADRIGAGPSSRKPSRSGSGGGAVAVIPVYGVIMPRADLFMEISGGTSLATFASQLRQSVDDPQVGSILLDIDSPGGSASMLPETAALIRAANAKKPVTAVSNTMAASAAYYLASQAGEVVVSPSSLTGSIGTFLAHEDVSGMEEKLGVKTTLIAAGKYKVEANEHQPLSEEARAALQAIVDDFYGQFVADVAKGRGVSVDDVRNGFGEGRVVTAKDAVRLGMADRVATFDATLARMLGGGGSSASALAEGLPGVESVERIELQPDDKLLIRVKENLSEDKLLELRARVEERFPGHEAVVTGPGIALSVLSEARDTEDVADEVGEPAGPDDPARAALPEGAARLLAQPGLRRAYEPKEATT
jgi:signal peptide peptidase SppA